MALPTHEEITKIKDDLIDLTQTMRRHCESAWGLIGKLSYKDSERNYVKIDKHCSKNIKFRNGVLSYVDSTLEVQIEFAPEKAEKLAHNILADMK